MKSFLSLFFACLILNTFSIAQDVSGNWQGVLFQPGGPLTVYPFLLSLEQNGEQISGTSEIRIMGQNDWAIMALNGSIIGNDLDLQEAEVLTSAGFVDWCIKDMNLTLENDNSILSGPWSSAGCAPGAIVVSYTEVLSQTQFCEDEAVILEASGTMVRWYQQPNYIGFLGAGNALTLDTDTSTTVYYSQTFAGIQSPLLAVNVAVIDCTSLSTAVEDQSLSINIFPNPAANFIRVEATGLSAQSQYRTYTLHGTLIESGYMTERSMELDLSHYASGMYLMEVQDGSARGFNRFVKY